MTGMRKPITQLPLATELKIDDTFLKVDSDTSLPDKDRTQRLTAQLLVDFLEGIMPSESINGTVFATDVTPQDPDENVGNKMTSSGGAVLDSFLTTTELVNVQVLALPGHTNWRPNITVNGSPVVLTAQADQPVFTGSISIDLAGAEEILLQHEDGATHKVAVFREALPEVVSAAFTGGYPAGQTELKEGDTYDLQVISDVDIVAIQVDDFGALKPQTVSVASGPIHIITCTVADRGNTTQTLGARVRVQSSTGAWSHWFLTESLGSVDEIHVVRLNNTP